MFISYKKIIVESWQIAIRNKILWVFGIFAAFVSLENVYEIILGQLAQAKDPAIFYQNILNIFTKQTTFTNKSLEALNLLKFDFNGLIAFIIVGAVIIFLIWLAITSQVFIIKSVSLIYRGKKILANLVFNQSDDCFLPVLSLQILTKLFLYAGFIALSLPLLYLLLINNITGLIYLNVVFFIVYILFSVVISFLAAYATNFIVLKDLDVVSAISAAWKLFQKNILISLEIATILFVLKLVSLIIIFSLFSLFVIPLGVFFLFSLINGDMLAVVIILTLLILIFSLISLFINSLFTTFYLACWTVTFTKLTENTLFGKILDWTLKLPQHFKKLSRKHKVEIDQAKIKKLTAKIAKEANSQTIVLSQELSDNYQKYKPVIKKQSKKLYKQAKTSYAKYKPVVKKESQKLAKEVNAAYKKFEPIIEKKAANLLKQAEKEWQKSRPKKTKNTSTKSK